jgi:quercetin dioxygenase-like cupin family protein
MFTGNVYFDVIVRGQGPSRVRVNALRFSPCARTAWHSHSLGQALHVTDGIGIVATHDTMIIMRTGDTMHTPSGEEHWHGALTDRSGVDRAEVFLRPRSGSPTTATTPLCTRSTRAPASSASSRSTC